MVTIPSHLESTFILLKSTFPKGIEEKKLPFLLRVFYDELSNENLAIVISLFLGLDKAFVMNSIYSCASIDMKHEDVAYFKSILDANGFIEWLDEE